MPSHGRAGLQFDKERARARIVELLDVRRRRRPGDDPRPVPASRLGRYLFGVRRASNETRRRQVRDLIHDLREAGVPIAANLDGYWLAEQPADHVAYHRFLRRMGLGHLVTEAVAKRAPACIAAAGQLALFGQTG